MSLNEISEPPPAGGCAQNQRLLQLRARASELDARESWEATIELRLQILQLDRQMIGNDHPDTLHDMHHLARTYMESGRLEKAESIYLEVISARKRLLGESHPETLKSMQCHAWTLIKLGNSKEAENILVWVIGKQEHILGQNHLDTLASMHNLSWAYLRTGKLEEAEGLSTRVVEAHRRVLGDEHPNTLDIMHNLATVYRQQNRLEDTVELYRHIMEISERSLGSGHAETLHSMRCLAAACLAQGKLKEAEVLYDRIVSTQREVLQNEHPDTLDSMHRLASTIYKQGRLTEAETMFLQVVEARDRIIGEDNPSTLKSVHSLASTYRRQGKFKEAEELFYRAAFGRKSVLGEPHRDTIASLESLAGIYRKQAKWEDAEWSELELLGIREKLLGEDHPSTLESMRTLARIYMRQRRRREAEKYEALVAERSRTTFLKPPSVGSCASSLTSDQHEGFTSRESHLPHTNGHIPPLRTTSSPSPIGLKAERPVVDPPSKPNASPTANSTPHLKVPESSASNRSTSRSPSPVHYDAYSTIDHVVHQLHMYTLSFQYPEDLDFETSSPNLQQVPNLAYTAKNRPFLEQVRSLEGLQEKLDGIESHGDQDVRQARKETGALVERALADLEWAKAAVWDKCKEVNNLNVQKNAHRISEDTPIEEAFDYLIKHGCLDCTSKLDLSKCDTPPTIGGGFGDVWCGAFTDRTQVAIKCPRFHVDIKSIMKQVKRGARELYNWSKLRHENVLELTGIAMFRGQLAMISPWMENGTLSTYINKNPSVDRWELCLQVAEGLAYIHSIEMVHGDIKGTNVFVSDKGIAKLGDFGHSILQHRHSLAFSPTSNVGGGSTRWMAPELFQERSADRSMPADVYALGMTILEVVTGELPYAEIRNPLRIPINVTQGLHPHRPDEISSSTLRGDAHWSMLLSCWNTDMGSRPTAQRVRDVFVLNMAC